MEMLPLSSALLGRGILLRGSFLGSPAVPWWIMGGFWWLWKQEEWNNVVTIKHRAPCACWQPALPVCSSLPFPLPNISITWDYGAFPWAELSPKAVSRWEHLEQVRARRASSSAHEIPAGRGFLPKFHPSLKSSPVFLGYRPLAKPQRGWLLLQLLPALAGFRELLQGWITTDGLYSDWKELFIEL